MGLGITSADLSLDEKLIFKADVPVEFVCIDAKENRDNKFIKLTCRVITGEHAGKFHSIFFNLKSTSPFMRRKLTDFALAFYTRKELESGDQPLSRLYLRRFSAIPKPPEDWNGKTYQDFHKWKDIEEVDQSFVDQLSSATSSLAKPESLSDDIPF